MRQYLDAKQQYRDAIVFFRMGDFYEMFYEDALVAARALELTLTSRSKDANGGGIPMCGVPFHAADGYIARLVKKGFRVAICEQVEDPKKAKGLVRREVVRVVSPGTLTDADYLDAREPAFLMAHRAGAARRRAEVRRGCRRRAARSVRPASSRAAEYAGADGMQALADELAVLRPREIVVPAADAGDAARRRFRAMAALEACRVTPVDAWTFELESARRDAARTAAAPAASRASASTTTRPRSPPPARSCSTCATRRRPISRTSARSPSAARRLPAHRSDDAASISRSSKAPTAAAPARCSTRSIAPSRRWAAGCCALAAAAAGRARADSGSARRGRGARLPHHRARQVARDAEGGARHRAAGRARRARHRRPARSGRAPPVARRVPRVRDACSTELQAPLVRACWRSSTISPTCATRSRRTLIDEPPALARDGGFIARRRRPGARRAARRSAAPASSASPRWKSASARAPASAR